MLSVLLRFALTPDYVLTTPLSPALTEGAGVLALSKILPLSKDTPNA